MKMDTIRNPIHVRDRSHDMMLKDINHTKVKFTYECYNCNEKLSVEIFDGSKWNHIFDMNDLGVRVGENGCSYISPDSVRLERANTLFKKAETLVKELLS